MFYIKYDDEVSVDYNYASLKKQPIDGQYWQVHNINEYKSFKL